MVPALICFLLFFSGRITSPVDNQGTSKKNYIAWPDGNNTQPSDFNNKTSDQRAGNAGDKCSYWDVLQHLDLTKNKDMFTMSRPVKNHTTKTDVYIEMRVYALLDVREADQSFISYIWLIMVWKNEYISWNEEDFCGIDQIEVPREALWMPDITIEEMTEKDKAVPSPFLSVDSEGWVGYRDDKFVVSTCKMQVFKFPFDTQSCNLSFRSVLLSDKELIISISENKTYIKEMNLHTIRTQYEWKFIDITTTEKTDDYFYSDHSVVVYTITMKRKSALYVVNFLLPVLFFLCLDFATLFMPNKGGEKISFKVTVLLAVTVMQLILNEILPFTSSKIPLIVLYCIGIFALMLTSLLETILVTYLMAKDSLSKEDKEDINKTEEASPNASSYDVMTDKTSIYKEGSSSQLTELFLAVEKVTDELGEMKKTFLHKASEENKGGYWTGVAQKIDMIFSVLYILAVFMFLTILFSVWLSD